MKSRCIVVTQCTTGKGKAMENLDKRNARHTLIWVAKRRADILKRAPLNRGQYWKEYIRKEILKARHMNNGEIIPAHLFV
jgi:hypothetical protein